MDLNTNFNFFMKLNVTIQGLLTLTTTKEKKKQKITKLPPK